jgi:hypothetical protein
MPIYQDPAENLKLMILPSLTVAVRWWPSARRHRLGAML